MMHTSFARSSVSRGKRCLSRRRFLSAAADTLGAFGAGSNRQPDDVVPVMQRNPYAVLGVDNRSTGGTPGKSRREGS
jgi:hypothetical protein